MPQIKKSLKKKCKKLGVRLTRKSHGKRVYKSITQLAKQCRNKSKRIARSKRRTRRKKSKRRTRQKRRKRRKKYGMDTEENKKKKIDELDKSIKQLTASIQSKLDKHENRREIAKLLTKLENAQKDKKQAEAHQPKFYKSGGMYVRTSPSTVFTNKPKQRSPYSGATERVRKQGGTSKMAENAPIYALSNRIEKLKI